MKMIKLLLLFLNVFMCSSEPPQSKKILTRIVGGYETNFHDVGGFLVAIRFYGDFLCGGSLITDRIVVTAAHCISERIHHVGALTVEGGVTLLTDRSQRVRVANALIPRSYNNVTNDMDVAVMRLKKKLSSETIQTIRLCTRDYKEGDKVKVSGWGLGDSTELKPRMHVQSVILPMIDKSKCQEIYSEITNLTKAMICAGVVNEKDACQYDSGGPLVMKNELCGIVSFGVGCADQYPGVYTNVKYVTPWINKAIVKLTERH